MYGGYCFFNNAAIAAQAITAATGERVAILDVDYPPRQRHPADLLAPRRRPVRVDPRRSGAGSTRTSSGAPTRPGKARGPARTSTSRCRAGATNADYLAATDRAIEAIAAVPGSVVVVSLGFDTYGLDPIGDFALTTDVYHEVGRRVAALGRRLVILQEGGYHRPSLGENARAWLRGAEGRPFEPLPAAGFGERGTVALMTGARPGDARATRSPSSRSGTPIWPRSPSASARRRCGIDRPGSGRSSTSSSSSRYRWPRRVPRSIAWSPRPTR